MKLTQIVIYMILILYHCYRARRWKTKVEQKTREDLLLDIANFIRGEQL